LAVVDILIGNPAIGAAALIVAVHVDDAPGAKLVGVQVKVVSDCPNATAPNAERSNPSFIKRRTLFRYMMKNPPD